MDSKKRGNFKPPAILPTRKDPIQNQYITRIITQQDPILPTHLLKGPTAHKPFIDDRHFSNPTEKHDDNRDN